MLATRSLRGSGPPLARRSTSGYGSQAGASRALGAAVVLFVISGALPYALLAGPAVLQGPAPAESDASSVPEPGVIEPPSLELARAGSGASGDLHETAALESFGTDPEGAPLRVVAGRIPERGTLAASLSDYGVSATAVDHVSRTLRPLFDFRNAQPGDFFTLIQDDRQRVLSFEYQRGRTSVYRVERSSTGELRASRTEVPLERRVTRLGGRVSRSLFEAMIGLGEGAELVQAFTDVFIWDFDFSSQTRPGDEFRLIFEKFYDQEGFVRYGQVLAAQYRSGKKQFTALYFEDTGGYSDYYTPEGNSVRRTFLRAPVRYRRISSRYSKSRLHPILKVRLPHEAIDYVAPIGTPIWAVADGVVIFKGWKGGLGRLVRVRHGNGYVSYYGHLSRYAKDLEVGSRVTQKQVIGHVGKSGLATGPHLDYRLRLKGRFIDPLKVRFPKGKPISVQARDRFEELRELRLAELRKAVPPLVLEATM